MHLPFGVELPILVAVSAVPLARIVAKFVGEPHSNPTALHRKQFFDQPIFQFALPLAREELNNFPTSMEELGAVAPKAILGVSIRDPFRIARVPAIFCVANFAVSCVNGGNQFHFWRTGRPTAFFP